MTGISTGKNRTLRQMLKGWRPGAPRPLTQVEQWGMGILNGKVALVTGAGQGVGRGIALPLDGGQAFMH